MNDLATTDLATIGLLAAVSLVWAFAGLILGYRLGRSRARRAYAAEQIAARATVKRHREQLAAQREDRASRQWDTPEWSAD